MSLTNYINEFLRDAQYRIAELSVMMNATKTQMNGIFTDHADKRSELILFKEILEDENIYDAVTRLGWTDWQIKVEIEHLRWISGMKVVPGVVYSTTNLLSDGC